MFGNCLKDLEGLAVFKELGKLKEIVIENQKYSNPMCESIEEYHGYLRECLSGGRFTLKRIDEMATEVAIREFFEGKKERGEERR